MNMQYNQDNLSLLLAQRVSKQAIAAWESGEMIERVSPITRELLQFWFCEPFTDERGINFHTGQRQAILNTIYLHEVIGIQKVENAYAALLEDEMAMADLNILQQAKYQMPKYAIKMATGTGKTWVMHALVIWQLLNARHNGGNRYTQRFLLVAPGIIVYNRLLEAYLGKLLDGERQVDTSDLHRYADLFLPPQYREEVFSFVQSNTVSKEQGIGRKATGEGLIAITNWHLFLSKKEEDTETDLIDSLLPVRPGITAGNALDVLDRRYLRGTEVDFLCSLPDLMVINDEAHHVHGEEDDAVQWQQALDLIARNSRMMQVDFSATPYEQHGSGRKTRNIYFPHIIVDFDLKEAMRQGLVKSLMLDQRQEFTQLETLDYNAVREGREVIALSDGQQLMIGAGLTKLKRLEKEFTHHDPTKHPKMLIVCEDTKVTPLVEEYLLLTGLKPEEVLRVDSDAKGKVKEEEWRSISERLFDVDRHAEPRVIISVMMLREGFDVNNICVVVPLRSATSSILLEQTIGRGLRLMWRDEEYREEKQENRRLLREKREPKSLLDMLFIVEHPRFREFYDELMADGLIGIDDEGSDTTRGTGDMEMAVLKEDYECYDLRWPTLLRESEEILQPQSIDIQTMQPLAAYTLGQLRRYLAKEGEQFVSHSVQVGTIFGKYTVGVNLFTAKSYAEYLGRLLHAVTHRYGSSGFPLLQVSESLLVATIDNYIRTRLFADPFNPMQGYDWKLLLAQNGIATQHIVKETAAAIYHLQQQVNRNDPEVQQTPFSSVEKLPVRRQYSLQLVKTLYTRTPFPSHGGGLERAFMEWIDNDSEVERWLKISETRHRFASIAYMREDGLLASYHPDFLVQTAEGFYLIETKGADKMSDLNVQHKRLAASEWCQKISEATGKRWEYILVEERAFYGLTHAGATFSDLTNHCRISMATIQGQLTLE